MIKIICDKCDLTLSISGKTVSENDYKELTIGYPIDKFRETFPAQPYIDGKTIQLCSEHAKEFIEKNKVAEEAKQESLKSWLALQNH